MLKSPRTWNKQNNSIENQQNNPPQNPPKHPKTLPTPQKNHQNTVPTTSSLHFPVSPREAWHLRAPGAQSRRLTLQGASAQELVSPLGSVGWEGNLGGLSLKKVFFL